MQKSAAGATSVEGVRTMQRFFYVQRFLIAGLAAIAALAFSAQAYAQYATLYTWYSDGRKDHFTTSSPGWAGNIGDRRSPDYRLIRIEGSVLSPDYPQPADTSPIYSFWNGERQDNFLSSDPRWTPLVEQDGYRRFRLEGYVYNSPKAGTAPLISLWSGPRVDNYSTTDPRLAIGERMIAGNRTLTLRGGRYSTYRIEGYMLPPPASTDIVQSAHSENLAKIGFGAWRPLMPSERGTRPADPLARARARHKASVVIVPLEFSDRGFGPGDFARFGKFASANDGLSLERGVNAISRGKFSWQGRLTPVVRERLTQAQYFKIDDASRAHYRQTQTLSDGTVVNWTPEEFQRRHGFALSVYDLDGDGIEDDEVNIRTRVLKLADRCFNTYDVNGDGAVDNSELIVVRFGADPGNGGQMGGSSTYIGDGKRVTIPVALLAKDTTRAGVMHEMLHVWGGMDVYGPRLMLNFRNTIMAAMAGDDSVWELDPWHLAKFGWIRPRFVPIGSVSRPSGGSEIMLAAGHDTGGLEPARPIVFYDPLRGLREYFVVQYRTPYPRCPSEPGDFCPNYQDNGAPDQGFAVWHVVTKANGALADILKRDDTGDRVAWPGGTGDGGHWLRLGTINPADGKLGRTKYLKPRDGELALRWWNGSDTGLRLRAGLVSSTSPVAVVQWRDVASPFAARLDILRVAGFPVEEYPNVNAGQLVAVDGVFGAERFGFSAQLIAEAGGVRGASVRSWSPTRLTIMIPRDASAGRYKLAVRSNTGAWSNGLKLQIPRTAIARVDLPRDFDRRISAANLRATQIGSHQLDLAAPQRIEVTPPPGGPIAPPDRYRDARDVKPSLQINPALQNQLLLKAPVKLQSAPGQKKEKKKEKSKKNQKPKDGAKKK